jgi:hypothetical protein
MAQRHLDLLKWMEEAGGRITAWRESAVMTKKLAHIEHLFSKIYNNSNSGHVEEAADMIDQLKDAASLSSSSSELVASKVAQHYEELRHHLNTKIKQAVATLTVGTNKEGAASKCLITIYDWKAMEIMGDLRSNIDLFSNLIMEHHIDPLFQVATSPTHQVIKGADIERSIYKILKSIIETAFDNSEDDNDTGGLMRRYTALFGDVFWPQLSREWVTKRLLKHQDDDDNRDRDGRDSFVKIAGVGMKLETKARKLHFLNETITASTAAVDWVDGADGSNEEEGPMSRLIRTATTKVYTSKQSDLIAAAQKFINTRTTNTVTIKNQYKNNKTYVVSESAAGLAELIQETMKEAIRSDGGGVKMGHRRNNNHQHSSSVVVEVAQRSVTDIVSLFLADAVQWRLGLLSSSSSGLGGAVPPYVLVIKYNDMRHIHAALCATSTLLLQHDGNDDDATSGGSIFISQAMRVEQEAEQVMDYLLRSTTSELFTIIEDFDHFRNLTNGGSSKVRKCQKAGIQLVHALRRLGSVLDNRSSGGVIMEEAVLNRIVVHVLHSISERLCFDILALSDISVEDSELIPSILNDFNSDAVSAMLPASLELRKDIVIENSSMTITLQKLKVLCEIMRGRLVEIRGWWESGRLSGVGLTGQEVIRMIKALFEDTEHRTEVIKTIRDW